MFFILCFRSSGEGTSSVHRASNHTQIGRKRKRDRQGDTLTQEDREIKSKRERSVSAKMLRYAHNTPGVKT